MFREGDTEWGSLACGQVAGRIHDIPTCRELLQGIVSEAENVARSVWQKARVAAIANYRR